MVTLMTNKHSATDTTKSLSARDLLERGWEELSHRWLLSLARSSGLLALKFGRVKESGRER